MTSDLTMCITASPDEISVGVQDAMARIAACPPSKTLIDAMGHEFLANHDATGVMVFGFHDAGADDDDDDDSDRESAGGIVLIAA